MNNSKSNGSPNESEDLIFELGPFPMWIFDMETLNFQKVNTEAIRQYGYSQKEFLSMNLKDIRPEEDVPRLEKAIQDMVTREGIYKESIFRH
ncbi:MAG: PAS domain S-box protein, partial [Arenibacter sp.]|nr:PAS domain S-box protein [Arenibacter sp.]